MAQKHFSADAQHQDINVDLPCVDGLLVGTLALMTGYAEHQCDQGNAHCRSMMAKKITANLDSLAQHPRIAAPMAAVMHKLQSHWHTLAALGALEAKPCAGAAAQNGCGSSQSTVNKPADRHASPVLWHAAHSHMQ